MSFANDVDVLKVVAQILALMIAIIGHEIMHGFVAYKYKDYTAKSQNRLSINPISHIDVVGTIIVPLMLFVSSAPFMFGWAKPVPINANTVLRNGGYFGMFNVSIAGIAFNIFLAVIASMLFGLVDSFFINLLLFELIVYNVVLAMFNLLPIPPLDGSGMLSYLGLMFKSRLFYDFFAKIDRYGMVILVIFLISPLNELFFTLVRVIVLQLSGL